MAIVHQDDAAGQFESLRHTDEHGEYWLARDLQSLLGYSGWRDFDNAIERARITCANSGGEVTSNFAEVRKVHAGSGPPGADYRLSRYACYLVAMNGDPRKPEISAAQTYFAVRTREAELAMPEQRGLVPLDVLRQAIDHIEVTQRQAAAAKQTADAAHALGAENSARLDAIEGQHGWYAALAYAKLRRLNTSEQYLQALGRTASAIGSAAGLSPAKVPHAHYLVVNAWPIEVWDEAAAQMAAAQIS